MQCIILITFLVIAVDNKPMGQAHQRGCRFQNALACRQIQKAYDIAEEYRGTMDFSTSNNGIKTSNKGVSCIETWTYFGRHDLSGYILYFFDVIEEGNGLQETFLSKHINPKERVIDIIAQHDYMFRRLLTRESLYKLLKQPTIDNVSIFCNYFCNYFKLQHSFTLSSNICAQINSLTPSSLINQVMADGHTLLSMTVKHPGMFDQLVQRQDIYTEPTTSTHFDQ